MDPARRHANLKNTNSLEADRDNEATQIYPLGRFKWIAMVDKRYAVFILGDSETWVKYVIELTDAEKESCSANSSTYNQLWNLAVQEGWNEACEQPMSSAESAIGGPSLSRHAARGHGSACPRRATKQ